MNLFGSEKVEKEELEEWFEDRYSHLEAKIQEADMDEYEDQIRIVEWKGRQEELHLLLLHFDLGEST